MSVNLKAVAMVVVASLCGGISVAKAGFNETPYVSYLSGEEFDTAFPDRLVENSIKPDQMKGVMSVDQIEKRIVLAKKATETKTSNTANRAVELPAPSSTLAEVTKTPTSPVCAAEEIGYNAPCI